MTEIDPTECEQELVVHKLWRNKDGSVTVDCRVNVEVERRTYTAVARLRLRLEAARR